MNAEASTTEAVAEKAPRGGLRAAVDKQPTVLGAGILLTAIFVSALFCWRGAGMFEIPRDIESVRGEDLLAFWRAGEMALSGQAANAYDPELFLAPLPEAAAGLRFLNPPHFLLMAAPLGGLPYPVAKIIFLGLNVLALVFLARLINDARPGKSSSWPGIFAVLALSPAMFASLLVLQIGPFVALLLTVALLGARRRPIVAGLFLALLTMKPQFGLMAPIFLAARGEWRAIAATLVWIAVLILASTAVFGLETWLNFARSLSTVHAVHAANLHRDMVTLEQAARKLGLSDPIGAVSQLTAVALCAGVVFLAARRTRGPEEGANYSKIETAQAVGLTLLASAFASPSLWVYDWPIVAVGVLLLASGGKKFSPFAQLAGVLMWIAPLVPLGMLTQTSSLATIGFLAGGFVMFSAAVLRASKGSPASGPVLPDADDSLSEVLAVE